MKIKLKTLNKAFAKLGIELIWGESYGNGKYFYFIISDIEKCPLKYQSRFEKFEVGTQLEESFGYGMPLNNYNATKWMDEAVKQISWVAEHYERGDNPFKEWEENVMRLVISDELSKHYEMQEPWGKRKNSRLKI